MMTVEHTKLIGHKMPATATDGVAWSVCVCVCVCVCVSVLVTFVRHAQTAEPIEMPFGD